jgi:hypothetical protein
MLGMKEYWIRNREGLGVNILATAVYALAVLGFWWFHDVVPAGVWRTVHGVGAIVVGVPCFVLFFVPVGRNQSPPPPPSEEDRFPLSEEAETMMLAALQDEHRIVLGTLGMGQKGRQYNANNGVVVCGGQDAIQSDRFDSGMGQLLDSDYMTSNGSGEVFKPTERGTDRARRLPRRKCRPSLTRSEGAWT